MYPSPPTPKKKSFIFICCQLSLSNQFLYGWLPLSVLNRGSFGIFEFLHKDAGKFSQQA